MVLSGETDPPSAPLCLLFSPALTGAGVVVPETGAEEGAVLTESRFWPSPARGAPETLGGRGVSPVAAEVPDTVDCRLTTPGFGGGAIDPGRAGVLDLELPDGALLRPGVPVLGVFVPDDIGCPATAFTGDWIG